MIEVRALTKRYGDKLAADNVTFNIRKGEVVGFLGPNGAGKTTVMNMLTGYISSTSGEIFVNGKNILSDPVGVKRSIGYLPEIPPLYPDMTVAEYLDFVYDLKGCKLKKVEHLVEICEVTNLTGVTGRLIKNLSKGYKQRVGLAQTLIGNPPILIFDEPTVGLDPKQIIEIRNLIRRLGVNHTVILSSHILTEVQAVCERIIIIKDGSVVRDQSTEAMLTASTPTDRFGLRVAGPQDAVMQCIGKIDGVIKAEYVGTLEKASVDIIIEAKKDSDIRKKVFLECAKHGWYLLMMTPLGMSLEDVFMELTQDQPKQLDSERGKDKK